MDNEISLAMANDPPAPINSERNDSRSTPSDEFNLVEVRESAEATGEDPVSAEILDVVAQLFRNFSKEHVERAMKLYFTSILIKEGESTYNKDIRELLGEDIQFPFQKLRSLESAVTDLEDDSLPDKDSPVTSENENQSDPGSSENGSNQGEPEARIRSESSISDDIDRMAQEDPHSLMREIDFLREENESFRTANIELRKTVSSLQDIHSEAVEKKLELKKKLNTIEKETEIVMLQNEECKMKIESLQIENKGLLEDYRGMQKRLENVGKQNRNLEKINRILKEEMLQLKQDTLMQLQRRDNELVQMRPQFAAAKNEIQNLRLSYNQERAARMEYESRWKNNEMKMSRNAEPLQTQIQKLQQQLHVAMMAESHMKPQEKNMARRSMYPVSRQQMEVGQEMFIDRRDPAMRRNDDPYRQVPSYDVVDKQSYFPKRSGHLSTEAAHYYPDRRSPNFPLSDQVGEPAHAFHNVPNAAHMAEMEPTENPYRGMHMQH